MQFTAGSLVFLGMAAFTRLASAQAVAFGQQLQNDDQTNHWVAWAEGEHACPGMQVLNELTESPCDQAFQIGEVLYTCTGCSSGSNAPTAILDSGGLQVRPTNSFSSPLGRIWASFLQSTPETLELFFCSAMTNSAVYHRSVRAAMPATRSTAMMVSTISSSMACALSPLELRLNLVR